jgi:hypothetical protein
MGDEVPQEFIERNAVYANRCVIKHQTLINNQKNTDI